MVPLTPPGRWLADPKASEPTIAAEVRPPACSVRFELSIMLMSTPATRPTPKQIASDSPGRSRTKRSASMYLARTWSAACFAVFCTVSAARFEYWRMFSAAWPKVEAAEPDNSFRYFSIASRPSPVLR